MASTIFTNKDLSVKFYQTQDERFIINIDDISFMKLIPCPETNDEGNTTINPRASHYELYMRGTNNSLMISYRDGIQLINIMMTANYGLYHDNVKELSFLKDSFQMPQELPFKVSYVGDLKYNSVSTTYKDNKNYINNWVDVNGNQYPNIEQPNLINEEEE